MQNTDNSVLDTFKHDTKKYLDIFCAEYGIEDLMKAPQNTFESALSYAGDVVFSNLTFRLV